MNHTTVRQTTPRVKLGKVQKKNFYQQTPNYYLTTFKQLTFERRNPGKGYFHPASIDDIQRFITLIPDWRDVSKGLNAIVLDSGCDSSDGYHCPGVIHLCAVSDDMWQEFSTEHFEEHQDIFERLGVPFRVNGDQVTCFFDEKTIRAYYLLHIFLHELGHHRDRMTSKKGIRSVRGEGYAEDFARRYEEMVWPRFKEYFGFPGKSLDKREKSEPRRATQLFDLF
jgi:hypothetical protein